MYFHLFLNSGDDSFKLGIIQEAPDGHVIIFRSILDFHFLHLYD